MKRIMIAAASALKRIGGATLSPVRLMLDPGPGGRAARAIAAFAALALALAAAWWANRVLGLAGDVRAPSPALGPLWLPLLILLAAAAAWTGRRLAGVAAMWPDAVLFPDVERAWLGGVEELGRRGVDLREWPVYLILGRLAGGAPGLLGASGLKFRVLPAQGRTDDPIQVSASYDAIFVVDEGASILGRCAAIASEAAARAEVPGPTGGVPAADAAAAVRTEAEGVAAGEAGPSPPAARPGPSADAEAGREMERAERRLRALCRLVARDRLPYCPVNGIVLALPFRATQSEELAVEFGAACRRELEAVREILGVDCPVLVLFGDLEQAEGFRELASRLPEGGRAGAVGVDIPLAADVPPARWPDFVRRTVSWATHENFSALANGPLAHEPGTMPGRANEPIARLLHAVHRSHREIMRILLAGVMGDGHSSSGLAGVYLAGTGAEEADRAFGEAVFRRALHVQNAVSWTRSTLERDARRRRMAAWGFAAVMFWAAAVAAAVAAIYRRDGS